MCVEQDDRFNRELDANSNSKTQSVLIVPIKTREGQLLGVAIAENRLANSYSHTATTFKFSVSDADKPWQLLESGAVDCVSDTASRKLSEQSEPEHNRPASAVELAVTAGRFSPLNTNSRKVSSSQSECTSRKSLDDVCPCTNGRKSSQPEFCARTVERKHSGRKESRMCVAFSPDDQVSLESFVAVCAFALRNAAHFEKSQLDNRRSEVLLELARCIFREQMELHSLIYKIMMYAQSISRCERCQLLLIDDSANKDHADPKMVRFLRLHIARVVFFFSCYF